MIYLSNQSVTYPTYDLLMIYLFYIWFAYSTYNLLMFHLPISHLLILLMNHLVYLRHSSVEADLDLDLCFYLQKHQATGHIRQGLAAYGPTAIAAWKETASSLPRPLPVCFSAQAPPCFGVAWTYQFAANSWNLPRAVPEHQERCVLQQGQHAWTSTRLQGCQHCPSRTCTAWHLQMAGTRSSCRWHAESLCQLEEYPCDSSCPFSTCKIQHDYK